MREQSPVKEDAGTKRSLPPAPASLSCVRVTHSLTHSLYGGGSRALEEVVARKKQVLEVERKLKALQVTK